MEITLQQYERILKYLDGDMLPEEAEDFEQQLKANPVLKEHLYFEQELRENLESIQKEKPGGNKFDDPAFIRGLIKATGDEWEKENEPEEIKPSPQNKEETTGTTAPHEPVAITKPTVKIIPFNYLIYIAAAACIVLAILLPILPGTPGTQDNIAHSGGHAGPSDSAAIATTGHTGKPFKSTDTVATAKNPIIEANDNFFEEQYRKAEASATAVNQQQLPDLLKEPVTAYNKKNYAPIQKFDPDNYVMMGQEDEHDRDRNSNRNILEWGRYYRGLSYLKTGDYNKAAKDLQWVIANAQNNELLAVRAQLLLALYYIKHNNTKEAIPLLTALSINKTKGAAPYSKQAKEILAEIKQ